MSKELEIYKIRLFDKIYDDLSKLNNQYFPTNVELKEREKMKFKNEFEELMWECFDFLDPDYNKFFLKFLGILKHAYNLEFDEEKIIETLNLNRPDLIEIKKIKNKIKLEEDAKKKEILKKNIQKKSNWDLITEYKSATLIQEENEKKKRKLEINKENQKIVLNQIEENKNNRKNQEIINKSKVDEYDFIKQNEEVKNKNKSKNDFYKKLQVTKNDYLSNLKSKKERLEKEKNEDKEYMQSYSKLLENNEKSRLTSYQSTFYKQLNCDPMKIKQNTQELLSKTLKNQMMENKKNKELLITAEHKKDLEKAAEIKQTIEKNILHERVEFNQRKKKYFEELDNQIKDKSKYLNNDMTEEEEKINKKLLENAKDKLVKNFISN